jgi:hypothetical protein
MTIVGTAWSDPEVRAVLSDAAEEVGEALRLPMAPYVYVYGGDGYGGGDDGGGDDGGGYGDGGDGARCARAGAGPPAPRAPTALLHRRGSRSLQEGAVATAQ